MPDNKHTPEQDWNGMDGATAWQIIDRHADDWSDIRRMMHEWRDANSFEKQRDELLAVLLEISQVACDMSPEKKLADDAIASVKGEQ